MKINIPLHSVLISAALCTTAACTSSPPVRYHSLNGTRVNTINPPSPQMVVDITQVSIPAALEQERLILIDARDQTIPYTQHRWIGPLEGEIRSAITLGLWENVGAVDNRSATGSYGTLPQYRLSIKIEQFMAQLNGQAQISANWSLRMLPEGMTHICHAQITTPVADLLPDTAVRALTLGTRELSQKIGESLTRLGQKAPPCP